MFKYLKKKIWKINGNFHSCLIEGYVVRKRKRRTKILVMTLFVSFGPLLVHFQQDSISLQRNVPGISHSILWAIHPIKRHKLPSFVHDHLRWDWCWVFEPLCPTLMLTKKKESLWIQWMSVQWSHDVQQGCGRCCLVIGFLYR